MTYKDSAKRNARAKLWYAANRERVRARNYANREAIHAQQRTYKKAKYAELRKLAMDHYGGQVCACCGLTGYPFLTLDHTNNDGAAHRKSLGKDARGGRMIFYLAQHNWPDVGLQVLCWNCNMAKAHNGGVCPHKT